MTQITYQILETQDIEKMSGEEAKAILDDLVSMYGYKIAKNEECGNWIIL